MAELAEDKGDLVAEQSRGVIQALGKRIDGVDGGGKVGGRSEIAETEHRAVSLEEREFGVEEGLLQLGDTGLIGLEGHWRSRVDGGEIAVRK